MAPALLMAIGMAMAGAPAATASTAAAPDAAAGRPPGIPAVQPVRAGDLLACRLRTTGLPGRRARLSMESGLVSSLELLLDVLDEDREVVAANRITFRLAFDLWQEVFAVTGPGGERRFADLAGLVAYLAQPPPLPVARLADLPRGRPLRLRVGLLVHPVAPAERERVEEVIAGEPGAGPDPAREPEREGRQATIGLGRLIRFFYRGAAERPLPEVETESPRFRVEELSDAD